MFNKKTTIYYKLVLILIFILISFLSYFLLGIYYYIFFISLFFVIVVICFLKSNYKVLLEKEIVPYRNSEIEYFFFKNKDCSNIKYKLVSDDILIIHIPKK